MNHLITILAMAVMATCPEQSYARSSGAAAGAVAGAAAGAAVSAGIAASAANIAAAVNSNNSQYSVQQDEGPAYDSLLYFKGQPLYKDKNGLIVGLCESSGWSGKVNCKTFQQLDDEAGCEMKTFVCLPYNVEFLIYCRRAQK